MRPTPSDQPQGLSTLLVAALAFGAAGFGFGSYFYFVPFQRKAAQLDRVQKELRARSEPRPRMDVRSEDAATRARNAMKSFKTEVEARLATAGATVILGPTRMIVRFPEERIFEARGPWLSKPGQELVQELGGILGARAHRVVIAAPMGNGTVPRWVKAQLPTPADLSAARAGNALKLLVKGGIRAEVVLAVVGSLQAEAGVEGAPTLDFEIEP